MHKKDWIRDQDGRIIRSIEINDLLEIFPHKAQCFRRRSGEERFEALLEGGLWAEGQIRNTIRNRLANTSFDAVTGELLLDEEPTTPDIVFHGIVPGRITENEGPDWIQQRRRSKAELREKRRIRKERREQKLKA